MGRGNENENGVKREVKKERNLGEGNERKVANVSRCGARGHDDIHKVYQHNSLHVPLLIYTFQNTTLSAC